MVLAVVQTVSAVIVLLNVERAVQVIAMLKLSVDNMVLLARIPALWMSAAPSLGKIAYSCSSHERLTWFPGSAEKLMTSAWKAVKTAMVDAVWSIAQAAAGQVLANARLATMSLGRTLANVRVWVSSSIPTRYW
jgi:hypothetical protein